MFLRMIALSLGPVICPRTNNAVLQRMLQTLTLRVYSYLKIVELLCDEPARSKDLGHLYALL